MFDAQHSTNRRAFLIGLLAVIGLVSFLVLAQQTCRTPADSERLIESSTSLKEHDRFCLTLPRPADFELQDKMIGGNSETLAISYTFLSNLNSGKVRDFFINELGSRGWKVNRGEDTRYSKYSLDNYTISVSLVNAVSNPPQFELYCARRTQ